jgi:hypothetical protein
MNAPNHDFDRVVCNAASEVFPVDAIVAGIVAWIDAARLDTEPCGNIYMDGLFPEDLYREMQARLPADDLLDPIRHPDAVEGGRVTRYLLDLTPASLDRSRPRMRRSGRR